jgi:hypothetical protein
MDSVDLVHDGHNEIKACTVLGALQIIYNPPGKILKLIRVFSVS